VSDGTEHPGGADVVQARRIEVLDDDGRVRVVVGRLEAPDPAIEVFGVALLDHNGRPRVWLALDATGPSQVFDLNGNNLIAVGVNDPTADALHVGAFLHVNDLDGLPVYGWEVDETGSFLTRAGGSTRSAAPPAIGFGRSG
jgi:hypothetical protein